MMPDSLESRGIVWAAILRDNVVLVEAETDDPLSTVALETSQALLAKPPTVEWFSYCHKPWLSAYRMTKGLCFHIYCSNENDNIWTIACVFDRIPKVAAESFLEKVAMLTEVFRESDWLQADSRTCQELFGPILQQQMIAAPTASDRSTLDYANAVVEENRRIVAVRRQKLTEEQRIEKEMLQQMELMNSMLENEQQRRSPDPMVPAADITADSQSSEDDDDEEEDELVDVLSSEGLEKDGFFDAETFARDLEYEDRADLILAALSLATEEWDEGQQGDASSKEEEEDGDPKEVRFTHDAESDEDQCSALTVCADPAETAPKMFSFVRMFAPSPKSVTG